MAQEETMGQIVTTSGTMYSVSAQFFNQRFGGTLSAIPKRP